MVTDLHSNMFLLIPAADKIDGLDKANLHSNMFLLILDLGISSYFVVIYLHSNMFLLIPISDETVTQVVSLFTFQYVSINTGKKLLPVTGAIAFTFQYVSINTGFTGLFPMFFNSYLHSNMFLLIPTSFFLLKKGGLHLHSNMFLLIPRSSEPPINSSILYHILSTMVFFLSFYLFRYNTVHRKHYFAYVFHVCRPLVILSLSQVDNHKMKLVRSSFLPQNSLSIHFS